MHLKANISKYGVSIEGELDSTIRPDGDEFIAQIPALHLFTQGHTEQQAVARLEKLFAEYCEVAVEQNRLVDRLKSRGFNFVPAGGEKVRSAQYLLINVDREHRGDDGQEDGVAELAGAGH